jgi:Cytochrome P460
MRTKYLMLAASGLLLGAGLALGSLRSDEPPPQSSLPRYTAEGELLRPEGYRTWVFVGADLGLDYSQRNDRRLDYSQEKDENPDESAPFHNVYIDRAAYEHFARTGEFPDKTMLVLELFESWRKEPRNIVTRGRYEGNRVALEVAVKNLNRPDGSKTAWAYYDFTGEPGPRGRGLRDRARARPDGACYDCHKKHGDVDNVWVQFYPALRELRKGESNAP